MPSIMANLKKRKLSSKSPQNQSKVVQNLVKKARRNSVASRPPPVTLNRLQAALRANQSRITNAPKTSQAATNASQETEMNESTQHQDPAGSSYVTSKSTKPIIVESNILTVRNSLIHLQLSTQPTFKVQGANRVQINASTLGDKAKIMEKLKAMAFRHHTFTEPSERKKVYVLKGFYKAPTEEITQTLNDFKIPALKTTKLYDGLNSWSYIVHFENIPLTELQHNHQFVDHVKVRWESIRNGRRSTQCHRCQQWGHSSQNCAHEVRCVKCDEKHEPGACARTTREGDPKCCNCKGNHAANYRQCQFHTDYQLKISRQRMKTSRPQAPPPPRRQQSAAFSQADFPSLPEGQSRQPPQGNVWNNRVSAPQNSNASRSRSRPESRTRSNNLSSAQDRLKAIKGIDRTLEIFEQMSAELEAATTQGQRMSILFRFSTSNEEV